MNRFDIGVLTRRLIDVTGWINKQPTTKNLRVGYFGASTGSAAALTAAAHFGQDITAVVSRGGRADLVEAEELRAIVCPVLLIVGERDPEVIKLNELAGSRLNCTKKIAVVAGATHLFEEPGKIEVVARLSAEWFMSH